MFRVKNSTIHEVRLGIQNNLQQNNPTLQYFQALASRSSQKVITVDFL